MKIITAFLLVTLVAFGQANPRAQLDIIFPTGKKLLEDAKKMESLNRDLKLASIWKSVDPARYRREVIAISERCRTIGIEIINGYRKSSNAKGDPEIHKGIVKHGTTKGNWAAINGSPFEMLGVHAPTAFFTFTGSTPPKAAKITVEWVDAFGDSLGSATTKVTSIPGARPGFRREPLLRGTESFEDVMKLVQASQGDSGGMGLIAGSFSLPSHARDPSKVTLRITSVQEIR